MNRLTSFIVFVLFTLFVFVFGGIAHEADLSRNFNECGDAKAWVFPIKAPHNP